MRFSEKIVKVLCNDKTQVIILVGLLAFFGFFTLIFIPQNKHLQETNGTEKTVISRPIKYKLDQIGSAWKVGENSEYLGYVVPAYYYFEDLNVPTQMVYVSIFIGTDEYSDDIVTFGIYDANNPNKVSSVLNVSSTYKVDGWGDKTETPKLFRSLGSYRFDIYKKSEYSKIIKLLKNNDSVWFMFDAENSNGQRTDYLVTDEIDCKKFSELYEAWNTVD